MLIANLCHFGSVLLLFRLGTATVQSERKPVVPLITAILHILSPAGIFLCAPYTEAPFSFMNMAGMLLYVQAHESDRGHHPQSYLRDLCLLGSGICFAIATLLRSNGLLSGILFLWDVAQFALRLLTDQPSVADVRRLMVTCVAGTLLAVGFAGPQFLAYKEYCTASISNPELRSWCTRAIPSIYSWVQSHYW